MLEKFLALIERGVIALEVIADSNKPANAADAVKAEAAAVAQEVAPASPTGRRTRGGAANAAAGAGATSKAGATGGRSRASKPAEETAEQKALREKIVALGIDFAQYPDLVEWVNEYLQRLGCENVTQLPADKLEEVAADWQEKADAEFK